MVKEVINNTSKVWIYQADRSFEELEIAAIEKILKNFVDTWQSHGENVKGYFKIVKNRFIILIADDSTNVSGCSIDSSVAVVRELSSTLNVDLLDKSQIAFEKEDGSIDSIHISKIATAVKNNDIEPQTIIYNNAISSLGELDRNWKVKAEDSWMNRYFK